MKISQRLEYACRAMLQLAKRHHVHTVTRLDEIAQSEDVSPSFLVQIMNDLKNAKVICSKRGREGGYFIKKPLSEITLYAIALAVEPGMFVPMNEGSGESAAEVARAWKDVGAQFSDSLKNKTLDQLVDDKEELMFYI